MISWAHERLEVPPRAPGQVEEELAIVRTDIGVFTRDGLDELLLFLQRGCGGWLARESSSEDAGTLWSRQRSAAVAASSAALFLAVCLFVISTWIVEIDSDGRTVKSARRRLAKRSTKAKARPASSPHPITRSCRRSRGARSRFQLAPELAPG
jgi:hypothetical protein